MSKIRAIVSGGQTGADQGGIMAAVAAGVKVTGYAPKGFWTEDGEAPWLGVMGLLECPEPGYPARTAMNVARSESCLWFGDPASPGGRLTAKLCGQHGIHVIHVTDTAEDFRYLCGCHRFNVSAYPGGPDDPVMARQVLAAVSPNYLMVAGNRESKRPGLAALAERVLTAVLKEDAR